MDRVRNFSKSFRKESLKAFSLSFNSNNDRPSSSPTISEDYYEERDRYEDSELIRQLELENKRLQDEEKRLAEERALKRAEQKKVVAEVMSNLTGIEDIPANNDRAFIKTGNFMKRQKNLKRLIPHSVYLFNDLLLICKPPDARKKLRVGKVIDPKQIRFQYLPKPAANEFPLEIITPERSHELVTVSEEERASFAVDLIKTVLASRYGNEVPGSSPLVDQQYALEHTVRLRTLHNAAMVGDQMLAKELLDNGEQIVGAVCDIDGKDAFGATAMHLACWAGQKEMLEFFISRGAHSLGDNQSRLPAHIAAIKGHRELIQVLMDQGHPVWEEDYKGQSPLHVAVSAKQQNCIDILMRAKGAEAKRDLDQMTPFHLAVSLGKSHHEIVGDMILCGADPRAYSHLLDNTGRSPIHTACSLDDYDMVRILVKAGCQVSLKDNLGLPPILLTTSGAIMTFLVSCGARISDLSPENLSILDKHPPGLIEAIRKEEMRYQNRKESSYDMPHLRGVLAYVFPFTSAQLWVDDSDSDVCLICRTPYSATFRRHHCRYCGTLSCARCTSHKATLTDVVCKEGMQDLNKASPQVVCDGCFNYLYLNDPKILSPERGQEERAAKLKRPRSTRAPRVSPNTTNSAGSRGSADLSAQKEDFFGSPSPKGDVRRKAADDFAECLAEADKQRAIDVMEENKRKMLENQQKMKDAAARAAEMQKEADEFAKNVRLIVDRAQGGSGKKSIFK